MNTSQLEQQPVESVNPLDLFKPEWEINRKSVQADSFIVKHDLEPPDDIEIPPATHHLIFLQLSYGNRQLTRIDGREYEGSFNVGELFLQPSTSSGFYAWETTDEALSFLIKPDFLSRVARQTECLNPDKIELLPTLINRDPIVESIARSFLWEMQNEGLGERLYSEVLATQLGIHLLRNYCAFPTKLKQYSGGLSKQKLQKAIDYIQSHLEEKVKLDDLAQLTNTSSYHFCRLFKRSTGITPYQYVLQERIELGKRLLKQEDLPIIEISLMCGFADQSSFTTTFRKLVGITPRSYRQQL